MTNQKLWGVKIWDETGNYFYTEINISQDLTHNRPTESQIGYNSKYPFHTHNGKAFYFSGSCTGNFSDNKSGDCYGDYNFGWRDTRNGEIIYNTKYQTAFVKWMHNDKTKYLQLSEDLVIPVGILAEIQWQTDTTVDDGYNCKITFNWEQLADDYSLDETNNLYYCPSCNEMIVPSAVYCQRCGTKVGGA